MGLASVCSKVLLLLIHWLFVLSLVGPGCCDWSLLCYAFLSDLLLLQSSGKGINSLLLYSKSLLASAVDCLWCSVSLPHGVVGWAAVCNCGISWSYFFLLRYITLSYFIYHIIVIITLSH